MSFSSKRSFENNGWLFSVLLERHIWLTGGGQRFRENVQESKIIELHTQPRLFTNRVTSFHKFQYVATKNTKYFLLKYVEILNRLSTHKRPIESKIAKLVQRGSLNFYWPNIYIGGSFLLHLYWKNNYWENTFGKWGIAGDNICPQMTTLFRSRHCKWISSIFFQGLVYSIFF